MTIRWGIHIFVFKVNNSAGYLSVFVFPKCGARITNLWDWLGKTVMASEIRKFRL